MRASEWPPFQRTLWRAHRVLNRMKIRPMIDMRPDPLDEGHAASFIDRLKTVQMYMDGIRGKWIREKRKASAANRALENYRRGDTKTWKMKAESLQKLVYDTLDIYAKQHKVVTHYAGGEHNKLANIMTYLVDRSNQLFTNDSAMEKKVREELKKAVLDAGISRTRAEMAERRLAGYVARYGPLTQDLYEPAGGYTMPEILKEADSFPWKRGNPWYLGDYTLDELLDEVRRRTSHIDSGIEIIKGYRMAEKEKRDGR